MFTAFLCVPGFFRVDTWFEMLELLLECMDLRRVGAFEKCLVCSANKKEFDTD